MGATTSAETNSVKGFTMEDAEWMKGKRNGLKSNIDDTINVIDGELNKNEVNVEILIRFLAILSNEQLRLTKLHGSIKKLISKDEFETETRSLEAIKKKITLCECRAQAVIRKVELTFQMTSLQNEPTSDTDSMTSLEEDPPEEDPPEEDPPEDDPPEEDPPKDVPPEDDPLDMMKIVISEKPKTLEKNIPGVIHHGGVEARMRDNLQVNLSILDSAVIASFKLLYWNRFGLDSRDCVGSIVD